MIINFGKSFLLGLYRFYCLLRLLFTRDYIKYARKLGVKIGDRSKLIVHPYFWSLPDFGSEPYLISIGDHTEISFGCTFLTHDGSNWVFRDKDKYKDVIIGDPIRIGNNTFIGCNTTILPGVSIGDDCIVGAGSLVTKNIPTGEVWGGRPARLISTTDVFADKSKKKSPTHPPIGKKNKKEILERIYYGQGYKANPSEENC